MTLLSRFYKMGLDLQNNEGLSVILLAFIVIGVVSSLHMLSAGGSHSSFLFAENKKFDTRVSLLEKSLRNGVAYAMETGKCLDATTNVDTTTHLQEFREKLIEALNDGGTFDPDILSLSEELDFSDPDDSEDIGCIRGYTKNQQEKDQKQNPVSGTITLDGIRRDSSVQGNGQTVVFRVTVDLVMGAGAGSNSAKTSVNVRTLGIHREMRIQKLSVQRLGYVFRIGITTPAMIIPRNQEVIFYAPVFFHREAVSPWNEVIGKNAITQNSRSLELRSLVRTNISAVNFFKTMNPAATFGLAKIFFPKGISRRWTQETDKQAFEDFFQTLADLNNGDAQLDFADNCRSQNPEIVLQSGSVTIATNDGTNTDHCFRGYIVADTLTIETNDVAGLAAGQTLDFYGGFIVNRLRIVSNNSYPNLDFNHDDQINCAFLNSFIDESLVPPSADCNNPIDDSGVTGRYVVTM